MIGERKIDIPSSTVTVEEENKVHFTAESKIPEILEKTKSEPEATETTTEATETTTEATETTTEATETTTEDKKSSTE